MTSIDQPAVRCSECDTYRPSSSPDPWFCSETCRTSWHAQRTQQVTDCEILIAAATRARRRWTYPGIGAELAELFLAEAPRMDQPGTHQPANAAVLRLAHAVLSQSLGKVDNNGLLHRSAVYVAGDYVAEPPCPNR